LLLGITIGSGRVNASGGSCWCGTASTAAEKAQRACTDTAAGLPDDKGQAALPGCFVTVNRN
jgi:hypothetical protein